jgi:hypothetical protein
MRMQTNFESTVTNLPVSASLPKENLVHRGSESFDVLLIRSPGVICPDLVPIVQP